MLRVSDIALSSLAILCLLPFLLPVILLLKLTGEHEVFYLQERIGRGGKPFRVVKLATMLKESPNLPGGFLTRKHDPRVLPVGRTLRKWKINELPQLVNVWLGQMSFVGPRPQAKVHYDLYDAEQKRAIDRQRPGLTGLASIVFRSEEDVLERLGGDFDDYHDRVITPYKGELERWHAENGTIGSYWRIIFLTALSLIRPEVSCLKFFPDAPHPTGELEGALGCEKSLPTSAIGTEPASPIEVGGTNQAL
jgi:lipopolysaccharide/colanic/teichoic acid biosynthesis glycosyltransferase